MFYVAGCVCVCVGCTTPSTMYSFMCSKKFAYQNAPQWYVSIALEMPQAQAIHDVMTPACWLGLACAAAPPWPFHTISATYFLSVASLPLCSLNYILANRHVFLFNLFADILLISCFRIRHFIMIIIS